MFTRVHWIFSEVEPIVIATVANSLFAEQHKRQVGN